MPEPRTPPSKEECMALLSPAKFLLPANAFSFLPSPPDPSELPKPGYFNLTQVSRIYSNLKQLISPFYLEFYHKPKLIFSKLAINMLLVMGAAILLLIMLDVLSSYI